jgi:hypothetical protein
MLNIPLRWCLLIPLAALACTPANAPAHNSRIDDPGSIVIVTKGKLGFRYRGTFYPVGMATDEVVRLLGQPDARIYETTLRYRVLRLDVGTEIDAKTAARFSFRLRRPGVPNDEPAKYISDDRGINVASTPEHVLERHGKASEVRQGEGGQQDLIYRLESPSGIGSVDFKFIGNELAVVTLVFLPENGQALPTTAPATTTTPTK